jgi:hypothetical protein
MLSCSREPLNKWRNRHNACLRADRGAMASTDASRRPMVQRYPASHAMLPTWAGESSGIGLSLAGTAS